MTSSSAILIALAEDDTITQWNKGAEEIFGLTAASVLGQPLRELSIPWDCAELLRAVAQCRANGMPLQLENRPHGKPGGTKGFLDLWVSALPNMGAQSSSVLILGADVTARIRAENEVSESEARFRSIVEGAAEGILIADLQTTRFVYANSSICRLLGYSREELLGLSVSDLHPKSALKDVVEQFEAQARGELTLAANVPCLRKNGTVICADIKTATVIVDGTACNVGFFTDITRRREAETRLVEGLMSAKHRIEQECKQKEQLLASIPSILIAIAEDGRITQWNKAAAEALGLAAANVLGQPLRQLSVSWDWAPILVAVAQCRDNGGIVRLDNVHYTRPDGSDGLLGLTINPFAETGGESSGVLIHAADVTERVALELQLRQSQKLESIGQLAAGIAHEINTPTQYVSDNVVFLNRAFGTLMEALGSCDALVKAAKDGHFAPDAVEQAHTALRKAKVDFLAKQVPRALEQSLDGLGRVASIVGAMKEFAHPSSGEKHPVELRQAIETTLMVARNEWKYVAETATDFDPSLPPVPCLRDEFNQVILNLVVNAAHAISDVTGGGAKGKGQITLTTRLAGEWAEIRVSDSGAGIPAEIRGRIFDPFFTTKEVGKGTGQGLAIARSVIVDKHRGHITVESEVGTGTTFIIWLPLKDDASAATEEAA